MGMSRARDLDRFYEVLARLQSKLGGCRCLGACGGGGSDGWRWPLQGVYFFFEPGEMREDGRTPRVVRVGTHAVSEGSKTTLWQRLSRHKGHERGKYAGGGNHRGSVFRLHVGAALLAASGRAADDAWDRARATGYAAEDDAEGCASGRRSGVRAADYAKGCAGGRSGGRAGAGGRAEDCAEDCARDGAGDHACSRALHRAGDWVGDDHSCDCAGTRVRGFVGDRAWECARDYLREVRATWGKGSSADQRTRDLEHPLECQVSAYIRRMPFLWVAVPGPAGRSSPRSIIESNAVALLSNRHKPPIDPPSPNWLGLYAQRAEIRESGLWNVNYVDEPYDPAFMDLLDQFVAAMDRA